MFEIFEIDVADVQKDKDKYTLVDVRESHELVGPEGQIEGIILATLGSNLTQFLSSANHNQPYVFVCRSGHRSSHACAIAHTYGFHKVYNMTGGMIAWNKNK